MSETCDHLWLLAGHPKHTLGAVFTAEACIKCDDIVTCRYSEAEWNSPDEVARREQNRLAAIAYWAEHPREGRRGPSPVGQTPRWDLDTEG